MVTSLEHVAVSSQDDLHDVWDKYCYFFKSVANEVYGEDSEMMDTLSPSVLNCLLMPNSYFYIIKIDDTEVGYVSMCVHKHMFVPETFMVINSLYVNPKYRSGNIIHRIIACIKGLDVCKRHEIDKITLSVANTVYGKKHDKTKKFRCDKIYTFNVR